MRWEFAVILIFFRMHSDVSCEHLPCTGKITRKGVFAPLSKDVYTPLIEELEKENIGCREEILPEWVH